MLVEVAGKNVKMSAVVVGFLGVKTFRMADINWVDINYEYGHFLGSKMSRGGVKKILKIGMSGGH